MSVHVEINGRPWCCWYDQRVINELFHAMQMGQITMPPVCAYPTREEAQKDAVEVLKRFGVDATVVEGPCPEYGRTYEEE